jgi:hypothetical protein
MINSKVTGVIISFRDITDLSSSNKERNGRKTTGKRRRFINEKQG